MTAATLDRPAGSAAQICAPSAFPIVIAQWDRNAREVVRVALDRYSERNTIDLRIWYRDGDQLRPARAGVTLSLKHLPALAQAIAEALRQAKALRLLDDGGQP